jgi:hypothetical protein
MDMTEHTCSIATININEMNEGIRMNMLNTYCKTQDLDIVLLKEVTHDNFTEITNRNIYLNVVTDRRGKGIKTKSHIKTEKIERLPSGRGISGYWNGLQTINLYARSGTSKKAQREKYFQTEVPYLLRHMPNKCIIGGYFNCVLNSRDCTGTPAYSKALDTIIRRCELIDAWDTETHRVGYTHYATQSASRIDRLYMSADMRVKKMSTEIQTAAFTDHNTVILKFRHVGKTFTWGQGYWKGNNLILNREGIREEFQEQWKRWTTQKGRYSNTQEWWIKYAKREIKWFFRRAGKERARENRSREEFYHACINELLQKSPGDPRVYEQMKYFKAKLILLHGKHMDKLNAQLRETEIAPEERPALYHVLKVQQKRKKTLIQNIKDKGKQYDTMSGIKEIFRRELQQKFDILPTEEEYADMLYDTIQNTIDGEMSRTLDAPTNNMELKEAIKNCAARKAPGEDGLTAEFYKWGTEIMINELSELYNEMFQTGQMIQQMKQGTIVCVPKTNTAQNVQDYRPLTLLNVDYKTYARILAQRMRMTLTDVIHPAQYGGVQHRVCSGRIA